MTDDLDRIAREMSERRRPEPEPPRPRVSLRRRAFAMIVSAALFGGFLDLVEPKPITSAVLAGGSWGLAMFAYEEYRERR